LETTRVGSGVEIRAGQDVIRVEPWGRDSLRVRAGLGSIMADLPGALADSPASASASIEVSDAAV
jgi:alpha-D-xyloside xylohydrolase